MRLIGTGKDPVGRYGKGLIFDVEDVLADDFVKRGWAEVLKPEDDPARTVTQVAGSVVRGDPLTNEDDKAVAAGIKGREHAIVHLDDPDATQADLEAVQTVHEEPEVQLAADALGGVPGKGKKA